MKINQFGRSMIEMLGVLAIVGVLSVGAIVGYQKAMMKYKLNKQSQQLSQLLNVAYRHKASWGTNPPSMSLVPYFKKLGEIPKEMIKDKSGILYDVFNNRIYIGTNECRANKCNEIYMSYNITHNNAFDICHNVYNIAKAHSFGLRSMLISKQVEEDGNFTYDYKFTGNKYCNELYPCLKDITNDTIYEACKSCDETNSCSIGFLYLISD